MSDAKVSAAKVSTVVIGRNLIGREGLRRILCDEDFSVSASVESGTSLVNREKGSKEGHDTPNLFILDTRASDQLESELEILKNSFPSSKTVVLSDQFNLKDVADAFKFGADGYIVKEISCAALMRSLRLVAMGEKVMPSQLALHLSGAVTKAKVFQLAENSEITNILSAREITTLRYLLLGYANKVIARRLVISEATVKVYVKAILRKLRVKNRTQAAIWAFNNGIQVVKEDASEIGEDNELIVAAE